MIRIERGRLDGDRPIQPDDDWFGKARTKRQKAEEEAANHDPDDKVYADSRVKAALEKLFHDKCAYCETPLAAPSDWDVEHFRPKKAVAERLDHPGYYWLAYEWTNLYPSCQHCNQSRRDRPRWGDPETGPAAGKMDQFPLEDERTRALRPADDLRSERRLLIDPCEDQPEDHLRYMVDGQIVAVQDDRPGETSIQVFHLTRRRLRDARREVIAAAVFVLKAMKKYQAEGEQDAMADFREYLESFLLADHRPYAGAARAVVRDPDAFGV
jgi:uncharacterized protein (TIGR02646 family)